MPGQQRRSINLGRQPARGRRADERLRNALALCISQRQTVGVGKHVGLLGDHRRTVSRHSRPRGWRRNGTVSSRRADAKRRSEAVARTFAERSES